MEPNVQSQFLKEIGSVLRLMSHKNLVEFFGVCQSANWLYLLFEETYTSLKTVLVDSRIETHQGFSSLSELFILQALCELSAAMEYIGNLKVNFRQYKIVNTNSVNNCEYFDKGVYAKILLKVYKFNLNIIFYLCILYIFCKVFFIQSYFVNHLSKIIIFPYFYLVNVFG